MNDLEAEQSILDAMMQDLATLRKEYYNGKCNIDDVYQQAFAIDQQALKILELKQNES